MITSPQAANGEQARLKALYETLRLRLLDLSKRNRMLNYKFIERSKRQLRVVDEVLEDTYRKLAGEEGSFRVAPLPEPDDIPLDENTEEFISALDYAKVSDLEYLTQIEALGSDGQEDETAIGKAEAKLRDKIREQLGLPKRPQRKDINRAEHARSLGIDPTLELPPAGLKEAHTDDRLQTLKYPDELERTLAKISDDARLAEQEMGVSTLFLAFGFLEWYESDTSDMKALAPLLLLPVRLDKEKVRGRDVYYLTARDSAAEVNLSLQKLLEKDFNREIAKFVVGDDESIGSIETYLESVHASIDGLKRWKIHRWLVLGHFAFGRFAMYSDLNPENWQEHPAGHPLLSSVLSGAERNGDGESFSGTEYEDHAIDDPVIEAIAPLLIHDADASQHSAVIDVMKGKNLVIQGPPGTGKSQTITNIIANAIAKGKKVLFLAEKQAALDVVKRRLVKAGLGEFCLELHSDKASPKSVIDSLKERIELGTSGKPIQHTIDAALVENRNKISGYLADLHKKLPNGATPFELMWKSVQGNRLNQDVIAAFSGISLPLKFLNDPQVSTKIFGELELYASQASTYFGNWGHLTESPWYETPLENVDRFRIGELVDALKDLRETVGQILLLINEHGALGIADESDLRRAIDADRKIPTPSNSAIISKLINCNLVEFDAAIAAKAEALKLTKELVEYKDIVNLLPESFVCVDELIRLKLSEAMIAKTPTELVELANSTIVRNLNLVASIEKMVPALELFELGRNVKLDTVHTVAVAIIESLRAPVAISTWLGLQKNDEPAFQQLCSTWRKLRDNDFSLRSKFPKIADQAWPTAKDLSTASSFLRKSGILKAILPSGTDGKVVREVCLELGVEQVRASADAINEVYAHVEALLEFENDQVGPKILEGVWSGLNTQFEEIADGREWLSKFFTLLGQFPEGHKIAEKTLALISRGRAHLERLFAFAEDFVKTRSVLAMVGQRTISDVVLEFGAISSQMELVLATGIGKWTVPVNRSVKEIALVGSLLKRSHLLAVKLNELPGTQVVEELIRTDADLTACIAASMWLNTVAREVRAGSLRESLISGDVDVTRQVLSALASKGNSLLERRANIVKLLEAELKFQDFTDLKANDLANLLDRLLAKENEVKNHSELMLSRKELNSYGLKPLFVKFDLLKIDSGRLVNILETLHAHASAVDACRSSPPLASTGQTLDARRKQFADRDRAKIESDRKFLRAILLKADLKAGFNSGPKKTWTEMALLRNEFSKQKRFTPVRPLLKRAGATIQALKPVLMMSPLSLAKYAESGSLSIDLLVIDEASQMKPEDALGGILRCKQIVVVGDQKQLPPTDFFSRSGETNGDDESDDLDDESILENCEKTFRQSRSLKWHYRSRCESLIRFANENFYLNKLITFPASKPGSFSIDLVRVDGNYQARRNVAEASAVAEEAVKFMQFHAENDEDRTPTLGIVAVNTDQRDLIREELQRLSGGDPLVDQYMARTKAKGEEFFIKNLENVQGDERDFIFVSMTYGRELGASAMKQQFGPINRKQGHRRLNVLFSRARIRIGLFCSFGSDDIKPAETSSEGVHVLKRYLKYVEVRGQTLGETSAFAPDSDFEREVASRLVAKGYVVEAQVGVSGYRIDWGVRNPDHPERFLAGIECDGAAYHSSKSARDRDRLREEILTGHGWQIIRVWSTDWFDNSARETEKLVKRLEVLRAEGIVSSEEFPPLGSLVTKEFVPVAPVLDHDPAETANKAMEQADELPSQQETELTEADLLESSIPLTQEQAIEVLRIFRDSIIRVESSDWQPQRSILREAMIETFISREIDDTEDWFSKVPSYMRQGTSPVEKVKYIDRICEIVARIKTGQGENLRAQASQQSIVSGLLRTEKPSQIPLPLSGAAAENSIHRSIGERFEQYQLADFHGSGLKADAERFYDKAYRPVLKAMINLVVELEAPVFEDVLVDRIARAHGFQRSGNKIYDLVKDNIERKKLRTVEGNRSIIWKESSLPADTINYRTSLMNVRSSTDTPVVELTGLAKQLLNSTSDDEDVLRKMSKYFNLERLRESTRVRFQTAINLAKKSR